MADPAESDIAERCPLEPRMVKIFIWANSQINANGLADTSQPNAGKRRCRRAAKICVNANPQPKLFEQLR